MGRKTGRGRRTSKDILLVEDNPGDTNLTKKAFDELPSEPEIHVVEDGEAALSFLHKEEGYGDAPNPDLVLLDLNLPVKSGIDVLEEVKSNPELRRIPVVVLTSSGNESDVIDAYEAEANAYLRKPDSFGGFVEMAEKIDEFWFRTARLPSEVR